MAVASPPFLSPPCARRPLADFQRESGATLRTIAGWEVAACFPREPAAGGNALVDLSHLPTWEFNGPGTAAALVALCGVDVPLRTIHTSAERRIYRLTPTRAIVFGGIAQSAEALDVTGGWATLALLGPDRERILQKITAVDLRERTLPLNGSCQGPTFGVNTLFGRLEGRFELHICGDSALFFQEVVLDAGQEFNLQPAGLDFYNAKFPDTTFK